MSNTSPPPEAQRFGRSQTPESPRPVHIPEPANIPVLLNQMDPVFNDTATYNIPHNQTFSPFPDPTSEQGAQIPGVDEQDAVQNFFREAEHQAAGETEPSVRTVQNPFDVTSNTLTEATSLPSVPLPDQAISQPDQDPIALAAQSTDSALSGAIVPDKNTSAESNLTSEAPNAHDAAGTKVNAELSQTLEQSNPVNGMEAEKGVDYQSLLDTIAQNASIAPSANALTTPTTSSSNTEDTSRPLPSVPGLPPKPPPQEHPIEFPSYSSYDNASAQSQAQILAQASGSQVKQNTNESYQAGLSDQLTAQLGAPPVYHSLQNFNPFNPLPDAKNLPMPGNQGAPGQDVNRSQDPAERPWSPRTQGEYDQFLEDERRYVTEGIWDKFPIGSRLFVGNLPSEKVTKRDLFHKFHKHGQLAQISIKQAYGFVQYLEAASCLAALNAEQGVEIRGRKVHLEISKPQKNTRNAGTSSGASGGNSGGNKNQQRRRSRSPDRNARRDNRNYSDMRDEPVRRRDEYRSRRSSSPRGYRQRDDYKSNGRDGRSRSPFYGHSFVPPPIPALDDEASLQLPRRDPRQVPDVQLLVLEPEVVQSFINWIEQGFRNKGLQASTIWVHNRFPLPAVIKRQIIEGVQAVVKLTRASQNNSKIPLQVFDRSGGALNVNFQEYADLDVSIAADIVISARQKERGGQTTPTFHASPFPPQGFPPPMTYGNNQPPIPFPQPTPPQYQAPQHGQAMQYNYSNPQQGGYRPPTQPPTPTAQPPNLQQLLANLRQPQNAAAVAQNGQAGNIAGYAGSPSTPQQYVPGQANSYASYNAGSPQQGGPPSNVQNIMDQLAQYRR